MSTLKAPVELKAPDIGDKEQVVVEKADAEELLRGWKKEMKIRKIGSRTKTDWYYTDPVTGYIFRSFKDVQRYLKTGKVGKLATKPKANAKEDETFLYENSSDPRKKIVEKRDVNLPVAINLEEQEEKNEAKEQMSVRSPVSGTLRHKRPLEHGSQGYKTRSKSSETSRFESPQRASKRLAGINVDAPSSSPPEPKTRQATKLAGIKIEAPSPSSSLPEPKTRQATKLAGIKIEEPSPSSSPLEPKTHQATRLAVIKIDAPPPTPPEPKTRQATRLAVIKTEAPPPTLPEPKTRQATQLAGIKIDASPPSLPEPKTRQAKRRAGMEIGASPPSLPLLEPKPRPARRLVAMEIDSTPPEPKTRQATRLAGTKIGAPPLTLPEPKTRKARRLAGIRIDASPLLPLPEPKTRQATRLAGMKTNSPPDPRTSRQDTVRRAKEAETRTAVNLATPKENDKIAEAKKSTSGEITGKHDGNVGMDIRPNCKQEISILSTPATLESHEKIKKDEFNANEKQEFVFSPPIPKEHHKEIEMGSATLPLVSHATTKEQAPPSVVPPVDLKIQMDDKHHEKQKSAVNSSSVCNPIDAKPESSSMNVCLNDFWTDPCIEFAVKTLTGAIPFGDLNKADNFAATPLEVPLEELWTDPCIEFAVKTLTGAIPVGEDDYLQHQPSSRSESRGVQSLSLPDVGMNFCQTEVLSKHFETMHNNNNKQQQQQQQQQQDSVVGNGVLQKPGVGQGSNSNVQCSRGRFFE